jgi:hypothetical protein
MLMSSSFYLSTNTGVTFAKTVALGSSTAVNAIKVHPTVAGDLWATTDIGLFHSTDYGKTFAQITGPTAGWGIGKPARNGQHNSLANSIPSSRCWLHQHSLPRYLRVLHSGRCYSSLQDRRQGSQLGHHQRCSTRICRLLSKLRRCGHGQIRPCVRWDERSRNLLWRCLWDSSNRNYCHEQVCNIHVEHEVKHHQQ